MFLSLIVLKRFQSEISLFEVGFELFINYCTVDFEKVVRIHTLRRASGVIRTILVLFTASQPSAQTYGDEIKSFGDSFCRRFARNDSLFDE